MLKKLSALLLWGAFSVGVSFAADVVVPWQNQFNLPPQDANGWSVLTPSADSRMIYVSDSLGNDANNGLSEAAPKKTIAAGMALTRSGYPDWVLLRKGDTWTIPLQNVPHQPPAVDMKSGRSLTERMVLTSYGNHANRPTIQTEAGITAVRWWENIQYTAVIGIRLYSFERDPSNPAFTANGGFGQAMDGTRGFWGFSTNATTPVRSLLIEDCVVEYYSGSSFQGAASISDIVIRRSQFLTSYNTASHSSAMYTSGVSAYLEENLFDHGGWYKQQAVPGQNAQAEGQATMFNHNTYFSNSNNTIFRKNIFTRPSSIQNKWTANPENGVDEVKTFNVLMDNNFYYDGEIGVSAGGNTNHNTGFRWADMRIQNNVFLNLNQTRPTNRGLAWGLEIYDWDGGRISGNILAHYGDATLNRNSYGIRYFEHMKDVEISENTVFNVHGTRDLFPDTGSLFQNIQVGNNDVELSASSYLEPNRSIETYMASLGQPATFDAFLAQAKLQSKTNWRPVYTAGIINDYFREGFEILGANGNRPPVVDAGASATITLPANSVNLNGTVTDSSVGVVTTWSRLSGPGTVTFGNANNIDTTATFSTAGTYVLQLSANDSEFVRNDTVTIIVNNQGSSNPPPPPPIPPEDGVPEEDAPAAADKNVFNLTVDNDLQIRCQNSVRVLTRHGDLVRDLICAGGNAIWDGKNSGGKMQSSGIYILQESGTANRKVALIK